MRKWISGMAAGLGLFGLPAGLARAGQASLELLAQSAVKVSKSGEVTKYVVPGLVTVALFAAAIYAICKSSRRV